MKKRIDPVIEINDVKQVNCPTALVRDKELSAGARNLYILYRSTVFDREFRTVLNNKEAAECLGVSRNTIIRWKKELAQRGWISVVERGEYGFPDIITVNDDLIHLVSRPGGASPAAAATFSELRADIRTRVAHLRKQL